MFAQLPLLAHCVRRARVRRDAPVSERVSIYLEELQERSSIWKVRLNFETPVPDVALFPLGALGLALIRVNAPKKKEGKNDKH